MAISGKFMGAYYRALDTKGRMLLPPPYLEILKNENATGSFWLTSLYGRITGYMPETWENTVRQLCEIKISSLKLSNFKTRLIGMAREVAPDSQGRIHIPRSLIQEGGLRKEIVLVGIMEKFEIWDKERFEAIPNEDVSGELAASGVEIFL